MSENETGINAHSPDIAIVGMACRFPGAETLDQLWRNLSQGVETIVDLTDDELRRNGVTESLLQNPLYVKRSAVLSGMDQFDASFFGISPRDAAIMDPQHRIFLECAWHALEDAGYVPENYQGSIGVYAGAGYHSYFTNNLLTNPELLDQVGFFLLRHTANDKDFLTTRVSYHLNLTGPSVNIQTACSTSLVAVHFACQSLLNRECDMALAGGVTIEMPHGQGYLYKQGEILSPDGRCRAFDASSQGTVFGSGTGIVVLKRLFDAIADRDPIRAVIKSSAINNDGASKVGYLAPSVDGHAKVVAEAIALAGVAPETITYVETHGTGTPVGDPIEIAALTQGFGETLNRNYCGVGSIKTNFGHLDTAAGVASLIKAVLALQHRELPPSLHFTSPNPNIDFLNSPFYVNATLREWKSNGHPRRAGVSSLGVGGTNAHVILEEAPSITRPNRHPTSHLLLLSAESQFALETTSDNLIEYLEACPAGDLHDIAYTCHAGRRAFQHRRAVICRTSDEAADALAGKTPDRVMNGLTSSTRPAVAFMFPGGGAQYFNMGHGLYHNQARFRKEIDEGSELLRSLLGIDLRDIIYPAGGAVPQLDDIQLTLPAIFLVEYAIAQVWLQWGVRPEAMIGHSLGQYTAACLAGVFDRDSALQLVSHRGRLMSRCEGGTMLVVMQPHEEIRSFLDDDLDLAAVNAPSLCLVSGNHIAIERLEKSLQSRDIESRRLHLSHASHCRAMEPILDEFSEYVELAKPQHPTIPIICNISGTWMTPDDATNPRYWARHLRQPVMFGDGIGRLLELPQRALLEVGPGQTLFRLATQHPDRREQHVVAHSLRSPKETVDDSATMLRAAASLWSIGVPLDADGMYEGSDARRLALPGYPFQRQRYWIDPGTPQPRHELPPTVAPRRGVTECFYEVEWKHSSTPPMSSNGIPQRVLVFGDQIGFATQLLRELRQQGISAIAVRNASELSFADPDELTIRLGNRSDYGELIQYLANESRVPDLVIHAASLTASVGRPLDHLGHWEETGFFSPLFLAQALGEADISQGMSLVFVSNNALMDDDSSWNPGPRLLLGPSRVIPTEMPHINCRLIDLDIGNATSEGLRQLVLDLITELTTGRSENVIALRRNQCFSPAPTSEPVPLHTRPPIDRVRQGGRYLITGGLGALGLTAANVLTDFTKVRLALVSRVPLPDRAKWEAWLLEHDGNDATSQKIRSVIDLESRGAEILVLTADVASRPNMAQVVEQVFALWGGLDGVIHAAGVLSDSLLPWKTKDIASSVLAPKVCGTLVLDDLLVDQQLDFFITYASVSGLCGLPGQIDYAAANAFLDGFAHYRQRRGNWSCISVDWSAWLEIGMAAQLGSLAAAPTNSVRHPLLQQQIRHTPDGDLYQSEFDSAREWVLSEHRFPDGNSVFPGTAYLELTSSAYMFTTGRRAFEIRDAMFLAPLVVPPHQTRTVRVQLTPKNGRYHCFVYSRSDNQMDEDYSPHFQATCGEIEHVTPRRFSINELKLACDRAIAAIENGQRRYVDFGFRWSSLQAAHFGQHAALLELKLPDDFVGDLDDYICHPALLDMATAGALMLIDDYAPQDGLYVPLSYGRVRFFEKLPQFLCSHVRLRPDTMDGRDVAVFDVTIMTPDGRELIDIEEFVMKRMSPSDVTLRTSAERRTRATELLDATTRRDQSNQHSALRQRLEKYGIPTRMGEESLRTILTHETAPQIIVSPQNISQQLAELQQSADLSTGTGERSNSRLESARMESLLTTHPKVADAFVFVKSVKDSESHAVPFVVVRDPADPPSDSELRRHLRRHSGDSPIPLHFHRIDAIPRSDTGEVDISSLPEISDGQDDYIAPDTPTAIAVAELWREALGIRRVGLHDNFLQLGGHSLLLTRLILKARKQFQADIPLAAIFASPTVAVFAEEITKATQPDNAELPTSITRVSRDAFRVRRDQLTD